MTGGHSVLIPAALGLSGPGQQYYHYYCCCSLAWVLDILEKKTSEDTHSIGNL